MTKEHYVIATGQRGRDRLRVLTRVFAETTNRALDNVGVRTGMRCLDAGCGGGDISCELARRAGETGSVLGIDLDAESLGIARQEAAAQGLGNIEYRVLDVLDLAQDESFDLIYVRFLLSHLPDPGAALSRLVGALRSGGVLLAEDLEFSAHYCFPENAAFDDYVSLYREMAKSKGNDPEIGPRLPWLLRDAGLEDIDLRAVQPMGRRGEVKLLSAITMAMIGQAVTEAGLASPEKVKDLVEALDAAAADDHTVMSTPRVFQGWGRKSL